MRLAYLVIFFIATIHFDGEYFAVAALFEFVWCSGEQEVSFWGNKLVGPGLVFLLLDGEMWHFVFGWGYFFQN